MASQYGDDNEPLKLSDGTHVVPVRKLVQDGFGYRHDFLGVASIMVVGFCVLFATIFAFAIKAFNFQRR